MKTHRFYRIETPDGTGVYSHIPKGEDIGFDTFRCPAPRDDLLILTALGLDRGYAPPSDWYYGFPTKAHLRKWFHKHERELLLGECPFLQVSKYSIPERVNGELVFVRGERQIIYQRPYATFLCAYNLTEI